MNEVRQLKVNGIVDPNNGRLFINICIPEGRCGIDNELINIIYAAVK